MSYLIKGNLCGFLCDDCFEPLFGSKVLLYLPWQKDAILQSAVANPKETFRLVDPKEAKAREKLLIGSADVDEKGNFEFNIDEKYRGTAFDIDFVCGSVPRRPPVPPRKVEPIQFHITTFYPEWRADEVQQNFYYHWKYCISAKWWCYIRGHYFDVWTICGHMYVCDTKTPIPNVEVTAWDADFFTDDNLGSAITDASGHFRIDYTSAKFKQTFLSPALNVETDPGLPLSFKSGPDVYFTYKYNGVSIQGETAANRRNNVGYCLCVNLCLKDIVVPPTGVPASFTKIGKIGNHFINEAVASGNPNVIALSTGKTPSGQAFYGGIALRGNLAQQLNGNPLEYSFDVIETSGPGGANIGTWKKLLVGDLNDAVIGAFLGMPDPITGNIPTTDYVVGPSGGVDASGWIAVPQAPNFAPNVNGELLNLNTAKLNGMSVNMAGLVQGQSTTTIAALQQNRSFKIRMVKREAGNASTETVAGVSNPIAMFNTVYANVPQFGSWTPLTDDELGVACLDIQEMIGGGGGTGCTPITNAIHVNYTAANPNMGAVSLVMYGPGGPYNLVNVAPVGSVSETFGTAINLETQALPPTIEPVGNLKKCAYTIWLSVELKLTNGESQHAGIHDWMSFCKG
jgi:hypothetical protein